jgi:carbon-monoxide dehydrogenase large subunit
MTAAGRRDARRPTDDGQPLGVKGAGQAGCIAAPPTIIKAILDALASLDIDHIDHIDMPATSERVRRRAARRRRRADDQICSGRSP